MTSQGSGQIVTILAANIKRGRLEREFTQRELAERMGVDSMLISKWERAWHKPSDENLQALARELRHDLPWFYTERRPTAAKRRRTDRRSAS